MSLSRSMLKVVQFSVSKGWLSSNDLFIGLIFVKCEETSYPETLIGSAARWRGEKQHFLQLDPAIAYNCSIYRIKWFLWTL